MKLSVKLEELKELVEDIAGDGWVDCEAQHQALALIEELLKNYKCIIEEAIQELEMAIYITNNPDKYIIADETNLDTLEHVLQILQKANE